MWTTDGAPQVDLPDLARFVETLHVHAHFFERGSPVVVARGPGRLDLMGGIADYSGALVLELPLAAATFVAAQPTGEPRVTVRSLAAPGIDIDADEEVTVSLDAIAPRGAPLDYADARALLGADPRRHWAAYIVGALVVLGRERGVPLTRGLRLLIDSTVPAAKGVSSSAALEVTSMRAVCDVYGVDIQGRDLAILCQMVENLVVGAPCGVMDQMTSACGEANRLLALLCQPAELEAQVALPSDIEVWGIDSGIRHAVSGADYGAVRVGAFMGYRIIADLAGLAVARLAGERVHVEDRRWHGYLANIAPSVWDSTYRDAVPLALDGATFLERYGGTTDLVTRVEPDRTYAVRQPTAHPIYEHHRVRLFRALLDTATTSGERTTELRTTEERRLLLGELMYQSHASYGACGLGSNGTDRLVEMVRAAEPGSGLYGAKITGGGSGGVVAVVARTGSRDAIDHIARDYERETGLTTTVLGGSSPGAMAFGVARLRRS